MSHQPERYWLVRKAVNIYLDAYTSGNSMDVVWSRAPLEFEPTPHGTKLAHDIAMLTKVMRLREDHYLLPIIDRILSQLPDGQHSAILAKYGYNGLIPDQDSKQRWYKDEDRAAKVGQTPEQFRQNLSRARDFVQNELLAVDTVSQKCYVCGTLKEVG